MKFANNEKYQNSPKKKMTKFSKNILQEKKKTAVGMDDYNKRGLNLMTLYRYNLHEQ